MKKLILILLVFASCSSPTDPKTPDSYGLENPPPAGETLAGIWQRWDGFLLSSQGLYDNRAGVLMFTDVRVSGDVVWYDAKGNAHHEIFYGRRDGNTITGTCRSATWTVSQGDTYIFPDKTETFIRVE